MDLSQSRPCYRRPLGISDPDLKDRGRCDRYSLGILARQSAHPLGTQTPCIAGRYDPDDRGIPAFLGSAGSRRNSVEYRLVCLDPDDLLFCVYLNDALLLRNLQRDRAK